MFPKKSTSFRSSTIFASTRLKKKILPTNTVIVHVSISLRRIESMFSIFIIDQEQTNFGCSCQKEKTVCAEICCDTMPIVVCLTNCARDVVLFGVSFTAWLRVVDVQRSKKDTFRLFVEHEIDELSVCSSVTATNGDQVSFVLGPLTKRLPAFNMIRCYSNLLNSYFLFIHLLIYSHRWAAGDGDRFPVRGLRKEVRFARARVCVWLVDGYYLIWSCSAT